MMLIIACVLSFSGPCQGQGEVRIKDITQVEGAMSNHLFGTGLVVGLHNTGGRSLSTQQMAIDMLRKLEMTTKLARQNLQDNVFKSTSISQVMVTVELPPFARRGSKVDVLVNVLDDAINLEGGTLIMTPLYGADAEVYVTCQGPVSIGGFRVASNNQGDQKNHPTVARIQGGGNVEREVLGQIDRGGIVRLLLNDPDLTTAKAIMLAINRQYPACAKSIDPGMVQVRVPMSRLADLPDFVSEIGQFEVMPDTRARVVINERTGTVIVGHQVRISSLAIAHGNLVIKPNVSLVPATPPPEPPAEDPPGEPPNENGDSIDDIIKSLRPRAATAAASVGCH